MAKATVSTNLRIEPEVFKHVMQKKGDMTLTDLIHRLLRLYLAGELEVKEGER